MGLVLVVEHVVPNDIAEAVLRPRELDAVLRTLGPSDRRHHRRQVKLQVLREDGLRSGVVPKTLRLRVRLDQRNLLFRPARETQVVERDVVDGEDRGRRTELRAHVADRRAVRKRDSAHALAVELDKFADDAVCT